MGRGGKSELTSDNHLVRVDWDGDPENPNLSDRTETRGVVTDIGIPGTRVTKPIPIVAINYSRREPPSYEIGHHTERGVMGQGVGRTVVEALSYWRNQEIIGSLGTLAVRDEQLSPAGLSSRKFLREHLHFDRRFLREIKPPRFN